jgi:hypothetical protein
VNGFLSSQRSIVGLHFFENESEELATVMADCCTVMLHSLQLPFEEMEKKIEKLWVQQDGAACHTVRISVAALLEMFPSWLCST